MLGDLREILAPIIEQCSRELSLEIVEWKVRVYSKTVMINIIADKSTGGITLCECAKLNKKLVESLDEMQVIGDAHTVDVSSPGVDRPLKTQGDFQRNIGRNIEVVLSEPVLEKKYWVGKIAGIEGGLLKIHNEGAEVLLQLENIQSANQLLPL